MNEQHKEFIDESHFLAQSHVTICVLAGFWGLSCHQSSLSMCSFLTARLKISVYRMWQYATLLLLLLLYYHFIIIIIIIDRFSVITMGH